MRVFRRRVVWTRKTIGSGLATALLLMLVPAGATAAPRTVPAPPPGSSVITVKTGGERTGDSGVTPLTGVRLALFANQNATTPIAQPWATCVSDDDGDCNFIVPDTGAGGANNGARYYVRQLDDGAPSGRYTNPRLRTGGSGATPSNPTTYQFQTPAMAAGQTYRSSPPGSSFMYSTNNNDLMQSGGIWQNSRNNPALTDNCGLDVALVMDTSGSMAGQMDNQRAAADSFVNSLVGTPSRVAIFSFSNGSPGSQAGPNHPELRSVSTQSGADAVKAEYANWQANGGTNWDQGLNAVAQAQEHYDNVIFITDGNPTYWGNPYAGAGTVNTLRSVENGVFSANAVKGKHARVTAFGVGSGASDAATALNLRAVSGPVAYQSGVTPPGAADYYQTENFEEAAADLRALAQQQCVGSLSVVKQIVPPDDTGEDVSGATNAGAGWMFDASSTSGAGGLPASETTGDDGTGAVSFQPTFPPGADDIDMTVTERQHPNHTLVTQDGHNAVCTNLETGGRVPVQNTAGRPGAAAVDRRRIPRSRRVQNAEHHAERPAERPWGRPRGQAAVHRHSRRRALDSGRRTDHRRPGHQAVGPPPDHLTHGRARSLGTDRLRRSTPRGRCAGSVPGQGRGAETPKWNCAYSVAVVRYCAEMCPRYIATSR